MTEYRKQIDILTKPYWAEWQTEWDITAVLKCILFKWSYQEMDITLSWEIVFETWEWEFEIQNKPLSLYTNQQNKNLLTILQQLQWLNN